MILILIAFKLNGANTNWTWNGSTSTGWSTKSNWTTTDNNSAPGNGDTVIIPYNSTRYPSLSANTTVSSLRLIGGKLTLNTRNLRVNRNLYLDSGTIVLNGETITVINTSFFNKAILSCSSVSNMVTKNLELNTQDTFHISKNLRLRITTILTFNSGKINVHKDSYLTFNDNATISGAGSQKYVNGKVLKIGNDSFMFPIGNSNSYAPVYISAPSSTTSQFSAIYIGSPYSDTSSKAAGVLRVSRSEYWDISRVVGTSTVFVYLNWDNARNSGVTDTSKLLLCHWNSGTSKWEGMGKKIVPSSTSNNGNLRSLTKVSSFSPFTIGSSTTFNPLPIYLLKFDGEKSGNATKIKIALFSDENDQLMLDKSIDGINWTPIHSFNIDRTESMLQFEYIDTNQHCGTMIFYRLRGNDEKVIKTLSLSHPNDICRHIVLFPNPVSDVLKIKMPFASDWKLSVFNQKGEQILMSESFENDSTEINVSDLTSGMYCVKIESEGVVYHSKFIKQ
ncbi:MAG TPA: T9SS type A sorting domain-containing protein [Bacteroidia bacterium]